MSLRSFVVYIGAMENLKRSSLTYISDEKRYQKDDCANIGICSLSSDINLKKQDILHK